MNQLDALACHYCAAVGCRAVTSSGVLFCARHTVPRDEHDIHFPEIEDDFADASQQPTTSQEHCLVRFAGVQQPVPGDAGSNQESNL
jgi:hypothetical protein